MSRLLWVAKIRSILRFFATPSGLLVGGGVLVAGIGTALDPDWRWLSVAGLAAMALGIAQRSVGTHQRWVDTFKRFERRVESLESSVKSVVDRVGSVESSVKSVVGRVESVESSVESSVKSVVGRVESVESSVKSVVGRVGSVESSVKSVVGRVGSVESSVKSVVGRVGSVESSVGEVANLLAGSFNFDSDWRWSKSWTARPRVVQLEDTSSTVAFDLEIGAQKATVMRQHLERGLSEENRQMLLKESLQRITIEVSGHCNRTCHFCPNEAGSRIDEHRLMSDNVFDRILRNLVQIDYQGVILLHFYNEPLADLENTLIRIGQLRQALPSARISFNTNGDHLRRGVLDQLVDAGLTSLTVSIYGPNPGNWNPEALSSALDRVLARVLFERTQCIDEVVLGDGSVRLLFDYRELDITFLVEHLAETGYDRGGLLQIGKRDERSAPCLYPFSDVTVDYLGQVVPCCNVYPDREEHKGYVFATIGTDTEDLFSVYASDTATSWRQTLLAKGPYEAPCATCTRCDAPEDAVPYDGDPFPALIELSTIRSLERLTSVD